MDKNNEHDTSTVQPAGLPLLNNTDKVARIIRRFHSYGHMVWQMLRRGVPAKDIIRNQFPLIDPHPRNPALVSLELTSHCNLRCVYCTSPIHLRPGSFMPKDVIEKSLAGIRTLGVSRVDVVGEGEATLHPDFAYVVRELVRFVPYVAVITNGQWKRPGEIVNALLDHPVSAVECSVHGDKAGYERARVGGQFERLVEDIALLKESRDRRRSETIINIRVMLRPSDRAAEQSALAFWKPYGDAVMPMYVVQPKRLASIEDVYTTVQSHENTFLKCSLPFRCLFIEWDGNVPLCHMSLQQIGAPGLVLGNVLTDPLDGLWNGPVMRQYREGHHKREPARMPICAGCDT